MNAGDAGLGSRGHMDSAGRHRTHPAEGSRVGPEELLAQAADTDVAEAILAIYDQMEATHSAEPPFHLTLLGVHDGHRGKGLGMGLRAESLARLDALGAFAYLESSNPANIARYGKRGFIPLDTTTLATEHVVTTMRAADRAVTTLWSQALTALWAAEQPTPSPQPGP